MDRRTFAILCHLLRTVSGLSSIQIVDAEEMVAMFLHILAHDVKNRVIQREFVRSSETVSRHFNLVLLAVVQLYEELIKRLVLNCLGALDGTYIKVNVPAADRPTFKTRKGDIATNVLGVCDTKGDFVYVLVGWEGSAANSQILRDALAQENGLQVPKGYPNAKGFLGLYRGQRCHLQEWRGAGNAPTNAKEYFNMKHSSVRNVRHVWTKEEESTLMECSMELVSMGGWKSDNGTFQPGYLAQLIHMMAEKLPGCRSHPTAKGLLSKPFPYYDELTYVFDRDRATGQFAETFADMGFNEPSGYERFDIANGNEEFPPVYNQRIDMSQDDVRASRPSRVSEGRTGSSGSKRKRRSQREVDVEGVSDARPNKRATQNDCGMACTRPCQ
ncbi:retrotransposon protein [Cucumis melo var. makuwa]|uniref:Retrotransposon protein n=1 Tax=Cucumis melo var. makuwa TaxID=1194695 RepID=A0A5A7SML2_CUCMM|nr:retrotransposon protein [Cucumis melo var. makuwa]